MVGRTHGIHTELFDLWIEARPIWIVKTNVWIKFLVQQDVFQAWDYGLDFIESCFSGCAGAKYLTKEEIQGE